jgi:hypothetical protein
LKLFKGFDKKYLLNSNIIAIPDALSRAPGDLFPVFKNNKKRLDKEIRLDEIQAPYKVKEIKLVKFPNKIITKRT